VAEYAFKEKVVLEQIRKSLSVNYRTHVFKPDEIIENQSSVYDAAFWKDYNVIKLHPRDEKFIEGLEEQMKLEEQFASENQ